jgi:hypothetical protein
MAGAPVSLTTDEVVRILADRDPEEHPVATSSYVAEQSDTSRPTALRRLEEAEEEGRVKSAEVARASVWWLADDPITARAAEGVDVVEVPGGDEGDELVADGAVGGRREELDKLLLTNREMIEETRAYRQNAKTRDKILLMWVIVFAGAVVHGAYGLPRWAAIGMGLVMFAAVGATVFMLFFESEPDVEVE